MISTKQQKATHGQYTESTSLKQQQTKIRKQNWQNKGKHLLAWRAVSLVVLFEHVWMNELQKDK